MARFRFRNACGSRNEHPKQQRMYLTRGRRGGWAGTTGGGFGIVRQARRFFVGWGRTTKDWKESKTYEEDQLNRGCAEGYRRVAGGGGAEKAAV